VATHECLWVTASAVTYSLRFQFGFSRLTLRISSCHTDSSALKRGSCTPEEFIRPVLEILRLLPKIRSGNSTFDKCAVSSSTYFDPACDRSNIFRPPAESPCLACPRLSVSAQNLETSPRKSCRGSPRMSHVGSLAASLEHVSSDPPCPAHAREMASEPAFENTH